MIIVTVDLDSANGPHRDKQLFKMVIVNDGTGDAGIGNYRVYLGRRRDVEPTRIVHNPLRVGSVTGHARRSRHVGRLIRRALESVNL